MLFFFFFCKSSKAYCRDNVRTHMKLRVPHWDFYIPYTDYPSEVFKPKLPHISRKNYYNSTVYSAEVSPNFPNLKSYYFVKFFSQYVDRFSLGGLLPHFKTLCNSCFLIVK